MRVVVQRCKNASCTVDGNITGTCEKGFMILVGFNVSDSEDLLPKLAKKVAGLRVFEDENGKMNKSLADISGSILSISQFTLYADCKHGNRPGFTNAMPGDKASILYDKFNGNKSSEDQQYDESAYEKSYISKKDHYKRKKNYGYDYDN